MKVVLFDGFCNLCNGFVNWVIDHDKSGKLKFASLQSEYGKNVIDQFHLREKYMETIVYLDDSKVYILSEAVLRILKQTGGIYASTYYLIIIPTFIRNWVYKLISNYRYSWFGKRNDCRVPTSEIIDRFVK